jgi:hypothetical protein
MSLAIVMNEAMQKALTDSADAAPPGEPQLAGHAPDGTPIVVCGVDTDILNRTGLVICGVCKETARFFTHGALCGPCGHYCGLEVPTVAVDQMLEHNASMRHVMAEQEKAKADPAYQ